MSETRTTSAYFTDDHYFEALIKIATDRINTGAPIWGEKIDRTTEQDCSIQNTLTDHKLAGKYDDLCEDR